MEKLPEKFINEANKTLKDIAEAITNNHGKLFPDRLKFQPIPKKGFCFNTRERKKVMP